MTAAPRRRAAGSRTRVLVVENEPAAGISNLGAWLEDAGIELVICRPHTGQKPPTRLASDGLIVLGGPMQARDDQRAPWLPATRALLQQAVRSHTPALGICLGAQLLAVACGGRVEPGAAGPHIGVARIEITDADDLLLRGIASPVPFLEWHFDAITRLPPSAHVIATGARSPQAAFRIGQQAWGLEFHPEVRIEDLYAWATLTARELAALGIDPAAVSTTAEHHRDETAAAARTLAHNFATLLTDQPHQT